MREWGGGGSRRPRPLIVAAVGAVFATLALTACAQARGAALSHLTVDVTIHHSRFEPGSFTFARGTTVTFVIRNADPIEHEFIVGGARLQALMEHTAEPLHDGSVPGQVTVPAGQTRETTYTFSRVTGAPDALQFACHLPGHYAYGMHGAITVAA